MFLVGSGNPVNSGIVSDGSVVGVHADNFVVFVGSVLGDPVAVEDSETAEGSADTFFSF